MKLIAYKALNANMTCRGFQYEVGKTYTHSGRVSLCKPGFHACELPFNCWSYYPTSTTFARVILSAAGKRMHNIEKQVGSKITIEARLTVQEWIEAQVSEVANLCKKSKKISYEDSINFAASEDSANLAAFRPSSSLAASGDFSNLVASGPSNSLVASGYHSNLAASNYHSSLAASGDFSNLAASNYHSRLAASGDYNQLVASGKDSNLAVSGDYSYAGVSGKNSIAAAIGINSTARAEKGGWIVLAEYDKIGNIITVKTGRVGMRGIKAGVAYKLENKKFIPV